MYRSFNLEPLSSLGGWPQGRKHPAPYRGGAGLETPTNCPQMADPLSRRAPARPLLRDNPFQMSLVAARVHCSPACFPGAFPACFIWIRPGPEPLRVSRCISEPCEITLYIHCVNRTLSTAVVRQPQRRAAATARLTGAEPAARKPCAVNWSHVCLFNLQLLKASLGAEISFLHPSPRETVGGGTDGGGGRGRRCPL